MVKVVTIFTDASHCSHTKAAGWAAYIKSNAGTEIKSNAFKQPIESAAAAEMGGVVNALTIATAMYGRGAGMWYIIACDNMWACNVVNGKISTKPGQVKKLEARGPMPTREALLALVKELREAGCKVEARHVKGHAGGGDKRSYVNELMDKMAKAAMKKHREEIKKGESTCV